MRSDSEKMVSIKDFEVLGSVAQIRCLAREERLRMIALLSKKPMSAAQLARELEMPANRAHYHVKELLGHGLIQEVGTGRKRWKEERYYLPSAHHYLMDPGLTGGDEETSESLLRSAEVAFLEWRRKQVLAVDLTEVAARVGRDCFQTQPGERILVMFGPQGLELAETIMVEIEALGARPIPKLWSRNSLFCTLDRHTAESLETLPFLEPELDAQLDGVIFVSSSMPQGSPPNASQRKKLPLRMDAISKWQVGLRERGIRYLEIALPHRAEFEGGQVTPEGAIDIYWRCLNVDLGHLGKRSAGLLRTLRQNPTLTLTCRRGTDLTLPLDTEHVRLNDGVISAEDLRAGQCVEELPAGSLSLLPISGSVDGVFVADYTWRPGRHFYNVTVEIREGRVVRLEADDGADELRQEMSANAGDPDRIAAIRFGLNPAGRGPTGKPSLDSCLDGVVTIAFGNNELLGGDVRSTFSLALPSDSITALAGTETLLEAGRWGLRDPLEPSGEDSE